MCDLCNFSGWMPALFKTDDAEAESKEVSVDDDASGQVQEESKDA